MEFPCAVQFGDEGHDVFHDRAATFDDIFRNNDFLRGNAVYVFRVDNGVALRRPGRGLPDFDNSNTFLGWNATFIVGDYRRIPRANFPREQTPTNLSYRRD